MLLCPIESTPYQNELTQIRYVTNAMSFNSIQSQQQAFTKLKTTLNVERLTFALNDDHLSQLYQTEILRMTLDNLAFDVQMESANSLKIETSVGHIQLDNQMFDLDAIKDNEFSKVAQKYDFPVIFVPRERLLTKDKSKELRNYYQSLDYFRSRSSIHAEASFMSVKLKFCCPDSTAVPFRLVQFNLNIMPFDVYLEDYLIYNLAEIGLEFFELASSGRVDMTISRTRDIKNYNLNDLDLGLFSQPLLTISNLGISRIDALVSLQTSIKIYLASYKMPIVFEEFNLKGMPLVIQSSPQIVKHLTNHYLTSLLFRAGWLLGSLELIGSPTAFLQQV